MFERILLPLDGSTLAECTIPYGLVLQRTFSSKVVLQRVLESNHSPSAALGSVHWRLECEEARSNLEAVAARFGAGALDSGAVEIEIATGPPADAIVETIRRSNIDLVLLSTHGAGGLNSFDLGGTALKVLSLAEASVLLVRAAAATGEHSPPLRRILAGVDGSPSGEWAARAAATIAATAGGELLLAHVVSPPATLADHRSDSGDLRALARLVQTAREGGQRRLERLADRIAPPGLMIRTRVGVGRVAPVLDQIACQEDQSLIVLGAHGHGRTAGSPWHYGSVAASLLQNSCRPVLVLQDEPRGPVTRPMRRAMGRSSARLRASGAWSP